MGVSCTKLRLPGTAGPAKDGVLCFGHPLLDMMTTVDDTFLTDYGIASGSVNLAQPEQVGLFRRITDDRDRRVEFIPGGAAMNTARSLAWLRPELTVSYVGALGTDDFADVLKASLANAGVEPYFEEHAGKPTGTCACLVVEKDRTLVANLGAAVDLSKDFILSPVVQQCIADASLYYAEGFFLNTSSSPDGLLHVAKHAQEAGKIFCLNLNAPYISAAFKDRIDLLMPYVDILFGSSEDILAYAEVCFGAALDERAKAARPADKVLTMSSDTSADRVFPDSPDGEVDRLHAAVAMVAGLPAVGLRRMVVATCGSQSTVIYHNGGLRQYTVPAMRPDQMVDLNGAGDAFVGGFLAQYTLTRDEGASALVGHSTAQNCIRHNGAVVGGDPPLLRRSTGSP